MVMAPFAKYFWFLCQVMNVLGCSLLSGLSAEVVVYLQLRLFLVLDVDTVIPKVGQDWSESHLGFTGGCVSIKCVCVSVHVCPCVHVCTEMGTANVEH